LPLTTPSQSDVIVLYTHSDRSRSGCTTSWARRQWGVLMRVRGASGSNCARLRRLSRSLSAWRRGRRVIAHRAPTATT
jgi:hypothetical protein